jgi:transcriptional regulator with XRE-family HTH domain
MKFAQILRQERELRGWSQSRAAQELGTTSNTVSAWERDISVPSPYFREKLCMLFGKNAQELGLLPANELSVALQLEETGSAPCTDDKMAMPAQEEADLDEIDGKMNDVVSSSQTPSIFSASRLHRRRSMILLSCLLALLIGGVVVSLLWPLIVSPNPYTSGWGRLALYDPMKDQGQHLNWQEGWNENGASCQFKRDAYYSTQPLAGYFHACLAQATTFHNFTYEVEGFLYRGDYLGMIFRATSSLDSKYYLFRVHSDGTYMLKRYVDRVDDHAILLDSGKAEQFHKGRGQMNTLAVVAIEQNITLYVNQQQITSVIDGAYADGQVGVLAGNAEHPPAEAAFRNVKVWRL